jgi:23S rRNA A1618 N6-methylase RlmF
MKTSLEYDLLKTEWISYKCTINEVYAQNLYAALCNNIFVKDNAEWTCSWRNSGKIVSSLIKEDNRHNKDKWRSGDYLDWYCSGGSEGKIPGYVSEGVVTVEISNDLLNLGWTYKPYEPPLESGLYRNEW